MATAIMKQKEVPEMDDVEKVISKISEESSYKRRPTQKRTWMTVPERYFEKWYANQIKYHKVTGEEPGKKLKSC